MVLNALTTPGDAMGFSCWVNQGLISASTLLSFLMRRRLVMSGWWWVGAFMLHGGYGGSGGRSPDGWIWRWELLSAVADQRKHLRWWIRCARYISLCPLYFIRQDECDIPTTTQQYHREPQPLFTEEEISNAAGWWKLNQFAEDYKPFYIAENHGHRGNQPTHSFY